MKKITYLLGLLTWLISCESINFDDPSTLTNEEAIQKIKSIGYVLTTSSIQTTFRTTTSNAGGSHFSLWADQSTNTNGSQSWWDFANEPRLRMNNNSAYRGNAAVREIYSNFYQANLDATKVIDIIENQGITIYDDEGNDRTDDCLIGAYYAKGVAQGCLGVIYDRGIIVDEVSLTTRDFPHSYKELVENGISHLDKVLALVEETPFKELVENGISHLDKVLALVEETPGVKFDFLNGVTITQDE